MTRTTSNQTNQDKQALRSAKEVSEMAGKIINRFGKAVQAILASAVLAGGLLLATPAVGEATHNGECHFDFTGPAGVPDGVVLSADLNFPMANYRKPEPAGKGNGDGILTSVDALDATSHYRHADK